MDSGRLARLGARERCETVTASSGEFAVAYEARRRGGGVTGNANRGDADVEGGGVWRYGAASGCSFDWSAPVDGGETGGSTRRRRVSSSSWSLLACSSEPTRCWSACIAAVKLATDCESGCASSSAELYSP